MICSSNHSVFFYENWSIYVSNFGSFREWYSDLSVYNKCTGLTEQPPDLGAEVPVLRAQGHNKLLRNWDADWLKLSKWSPIVKPKSTGSKEISHFSKNSIKKTNKWRGSLTNLEQWSKMPFSNGKGCLRGTSRDTEPQCMFEFDNIIYYL